MAKARVELLGSLSYTKGGRKFVRGQPQVITNAAEILYYQGQSDFGVTVEDSPKAKAAAPKKTDDGKGDGNDASTGLTEEQLSKMKKAELVETADELEILLEGNEKKSEMIEAILEAQKG
jgi:hypothetical protein